MVIVFRTDMMIALALKMKAIANKFCVFDKEDQWYLFVYASEDFIEKRFQAQLTSFLMKSAVLVDVIDRLVYSGLLFAYALRCFDPIENYENDLYSACHCSVCRMHE